MNTENKIKEDRSEDQRCCFCFPLRYSLITWGYFKMIVSSFFILVISYALLHSCMMLGHNGSEERWTRIYADIGLTSIALTVFLTDLLLTMLFTVRIHQKNMKMLSKFNIFSVVMWAVTVLLTALAVSLSIESWLSQYMSARSLFINLLNFTAYFMIIIVQTYFLLILRYEIVKLRDNHEFKFVTNAAETKCIMTCEKIVEDDTETEDD